MSSRKIILGIDPGLAQTGWGIIDQEKSKIKGLAYGSIKTQSNDELPTRLQIIHQELTCILNEFKPDVLAIERLFFGKNAKTAMKVGEARGVVMLTVGTSNIPYYEYGPAEIKNALTGYGNATKDQVQQMVKTILKLEKIPRPNHAADALAVAITHTTANTLHEKIKQVQ